jgi:F-type H+-transporting ATPase subunit epsilon
VALNADVSKVIGEGPAGSFGILPKHIDMATALIPGILSYETPQGAERFVAVNGGILVKQGDQVWIATRLAVRGELGELKIVVEKLINEVDERERKARSAVAKLEANFVRRFMEFGKNA